MMQTWDPDQYLKFAGPRLRPALDLIHRIEPRRFPEAVVDLGCGTGHITNLLSDRFIEAQVEGVDSSSAMLEVARAEAPDIIWTKADLATWSAAKPVDVLYSNAALHWLDDHETLFPRLAAMVSSGGVLAVQMPRNHGEASHQAMLRTVEDGPWRDRLGPVVRESPVATPERYYEILAPHCRTLDIWETIYLQQMEGDNPVKEFTKGTALRPFLDALAGAEREAFEAAYGNRILEAYPPAADGHTLFPFRRLFIVAERG